MFSSCCTLCRHACSEGCLAASASILYCLKCLGMCLHQLKGANSLGNTSQWETDWNVCVWTITVSIYKLVCAQRGSMLQWTAAFGTTSSTPAAQSETFVSSRQQNLLRGVSRHFMFPSLTASLSWHILRMNTCWTIFCAVNRKNRIVDIGQIPPSDSWSSVCQLYILSMFLILHPKLH